MKKLMLAAGLVALTAMGCARGDPMERGSKMIHQRVDSAMNDVNATPEQKAKASALTDDVLTTAKPMFDNGSKMKAEFIEQWRAERPDQAKLHALADQHLEEMRAVLYKLADDSIALHDTLNPEQREQLAQKWEAAGMHK